MKKLIVLYEENKKDPKNTWSGTSFNLREALKKYFEVIFIDSSDFKILCIIKFLAKRIEKKHVSYFLKPLYENLHKKHIDKKIANYKRIPVLEISENIFLDNDFYLYRDMAYASYSYVLEKFANNNKTYGHGMLRHISTDVLNKRIDSERLLIEKSKCNFFMGQWNVDVLNRKYPNLTDKFISVGGGINKEFNCETSSTNKKRIIFVGIDFLRKSGDVVIEAFKILKNKYDKDAELLVAGSEIDVNYESITCVGVVSKEKLSELFSESCVFCMPSRFEAYGLVFLEAQCYGLPIVAYDDYEMHYFVKNGENGYLIKNHNPEELAEALHKALNNKEMINRVRNSAKSFKNEHGWDAVAKKIADVINERSYGIKQ